MIGIPFIARNVGGLAGYDADAQAFFDRVDTAGGSLTATEKTAVNTLVLDMKSASIWTSMLAVYPMVGASAAACSQNLKSSSFTGTFSSGWTFASTGVTGDGTSAYMDTNFNVNTNVSANGGALGLYCRTNDAGFPMIDMSSQSAPFFELVINFSGTSYFITNTNTLLTQAGLNTQGLFQAFRLNATTVYGLRNTTTYTLSSAPVFLQSANVFISARNTLGTPSYFSNREFAYAYMADTLTLAQASAYYAVVQAFQTTLSRQV